MFHGDDDDDHQQRSFFFMEDDEERPKQRKRTKKPKTNNKSKQLPEIQPRDYKLLFEQAHQSTKLTQHHPQLHHAHALLVFQDFPSDDLKQQEYSSGVYTDILTRLSKKELKEEIENQLLHIKALRLSSPQEVRDFQKELANALQRGNAYFTDAAMSLPLIIGRSVDMKIHVLTDHFSTINKDTVQQFIQNVLLAPRPLLQPDLVSIKTHDDWLSFIDPSPSNNIRVVDTRVRMILFSRHPEPVLLEKEIINKYYLFINFAHVHVNAANHWISRDPTLKRHISYSSLPAIYVSTPSLMGLDEEHEAIIHTLVTKANLFEIVEEYGYGYSPVLFTEPMIWDYCGDYEQKKGEPRMCILYSHSHLENNAVGSSEFKKHMTVINKLAEEEFSRPYHERIRFGIIPHFTSFSKHFVKNFTDQELDFMLIALRPKDQLFDRYTGKITTTSVTRWLTQLANNDISFTRFSKFDSFDNRYLPSAQLHPIQIAEVKTKYNRSVQLSAAVSGLASKVWYWIR
jgi:hypothetical protein